MSQPMPNNTGSNIVHLAKIRRLAQENNTSLAPKAKVLFVDDEERILNSLKAIFRMQYDVTVSTDGHHAIELLKREHFHLLVSDQRMPNMQGVELLRRAKALSPNTVRILLTGFSDLTAIIGSVNEGEVYRYINKPWDGEELREIVDGAVKIGLEMEKLSPLISAVNEDVFNEKAKHEQEESVLPHNGNSTLSATTHASRTLESVDVSALLGGAMVLLLDHSKHLFGVFDECHFTGCQVLKASSHEEALILMQTHEVAVICANIDGIDRGNIGFLCLLKKEHPHIVAIAVDGLGDSETVISLVNSVRIFRVIFHPLRPKVMHHHLMAAFKQASNIRVQPALLKVQHQSKDAEKTTLTVMANLGSLLKSRMSSIKSFFSRR